MAVIEITEQNFEDIKASSIPVVIDLWAEWCGPCRAISGHIEQMAEEYDGKAIIAKIDVDAQSKLASELGVRNIPTVLYFKNGEIADKQVGAVSKDKLTEKLEAIL